MTKERSKTRLHGIMMGVSPCRHPSHRSRANGSFSLTLPQPRMIHIFMNNMDVDDRDDAERMRVMIDEDP